jgi:hypothetical protein
MSIYFSHNIFRETTLSLNLPGKKEHIDTNIVLFCYWNMTNQQFFYFYFFDEFFSFFLILKFKEWKIN